MSQQEPAAPSSQFEADEKWLRAQILEIQVRYEDIWAVRRLEAMLALPPEERSRSVAAEKLRRTGIDDVAVEKHNVNARRSFYRLLMLGLSIGCLFPIGFFFPPTGRPRVSLAMGVASMITRGIIWLFVWWLSGKVFPKET